MARLKAMPMHSVERFTGRNRHWLTYLWLLSAFVCAATGRVAAQYRFDSWTTENGLPQASVNSILQTRDGFLWLTTFGGLVRYDGLRFQVFNTGNTKGLRSGRFLWLYEDRAGNLWINTEGQGVTRYRDEVFTTYTTQDGLPSNQVWMMYEDAAGNLRAQTAGGLTEWADGTFKRAAPGPGELSNPVRFQPSRSGGVWYQEGGILRKLENGLITVELDVGQYVNSFYEDRTGKLWIGTRKDRLLTYEDGKLTQYSEKESYRRFPHIVFYEDQKGSLWLGTGDEGLFQFKDGRFTRYTTADALAGNAITCIYQDREGTLWIGTSGGLSRMTERLVTTYSAKDGLAADNVYPIYEDRQGQILIGSRYGLTRYSNGVFTDLSGQYNLGAHAWVTSLLEDSAGGLWIGTWGASVRYFKDGKVIKVEPDGNTSLVVRAMIQDRAGNVWIGCTDGLIRSKDGTFITYTTKDGLGGKDVSAIYEDRQGQLWIGTDAGLTRYRNGEFTAYTETDGVAGAIVRAIYEDRDGILWIGMYDNGLYRLKDGRFTHYTTREGLFDNGVFSIVEDDIGNFWMSCNLGIYRVRREELNDLAEGRTKQVTSVPYNKRDGMLNSECNGGVQPAGLRARDGRIWFPTQQGVAVIDPQRLPVNQQPPSVVIESLNIDTEPVSARLPVKLQPGQVNVEIHYSGLSFINPELVKFKYKLEGLDADWIDAGVRRTAYYAHLPPGQYRFRVIAANRDGVWNEEGATVQITVVPPFWRTWWFISGAALALMLIAYLFYRRRITQLNRAYRAQEEFSRQLIESQETERKRIAAELHDSVGQGLLLIKNRAALSRKLLDDPIKTLEQIEEIEDAATQSIKEVRQITYDLRPYQLDDIGLTQALKDLVKRVNESGSIKFNASIAYLDDLFSVGSAINLYRIVQEALNNIVKHSGASQAHVTITRDEHKVLLVIEDTGRGFAVESSQTNGGRRGFGLTGLMERARMLNGQLAVESAPGRGTTLRLNLPIQEPDHER
jgi:signal transduction histidine kinase/ligand-binding sensor domain-containing protein